jgi:hypothetical protein
MASDGVLDPYDQVLDPYGVVGTDLTRRRTSGGGPIDPYGVDDTPIVSVVIGGQNATGAFGPASAGEQSAETDLITRYCYSSDVLQLGDPFSVDIPDPHGRFDFVVEGLPIKLSMASPLVGTGQKTSKVYGVVTRVQRRVTRDGGSVLNVGAADLGWFLVNCDAPIWKRLEGMTFGKLYDLFVDPSWGFTGFQIGNDANARVKMGGSYARQVAFLGDVTRPPIVQVEPGSKPADYFIQYAKLANRLVNVSHDGKLQLYQPNYTSPVAYKFYHRRDKNRANGLNNVESASLTRDLSTRYSKAVCVGERLIPQSEGVDPNDPNTNSFRGTYTRPSVLSAQQQGALPFNRLTAFADPDRLTKSQAAARAKWAVQRGDFDAWTYEITVKGHAQGGNFFEPDTMCEVHDDYFGLEGSYYVSAVQYDRDETGGTRTSLTIKLPGLLAA